MNTQSIGESAFEGDESISVVEIPAGCGSIGRWAFRNCTGLWMVRVPAGCEIGEDAFLGCGEVYLCSTAGSPAEAYSSTHDNCVFVEEAQD